MFPYIDIVFSFRFQPMLMEYFTYEELKDIKESDCTALLSEGYCRTHRGLSLWNQAEGGRSFKYSVDESQIKGESHMFR